MEKIIIILILLFSTSFISAQKTDVSWHNKSTVKLIGTYTNLSNSPRLIIGKDSIYVIEKTYKILSCKKSFLTQKYNLSVDDNGKIIVVNLEKYKYQKKNYFTICVGNIEEGPFYIIKELN